MGVVDAALLVGYNLSNAWRIMTLRMATRDIHVQPVPRIILSFCSSFLVPFILRVRTLKLRFVILTSFHFSRWHWMRGGIWVESRGQQGVLNAAKGFWTKSQPFYAGCKPRPCKSGRVQVRFVGSPESKACVWVGKTRQVTGRPYMLSTRKKQEYWMDGGRSVGSKLLLADLKLQEWSEAISLLRLLCEICTNLDLLDQQQWILATAVCKNWPLSQLSPAPASSRADFFNHPGAQNYEKQSVSRGCCQSGACLPVPDICFHKPYSLQLSVSDFQTSFDYCFC